MGELAIFIIKVIFGLVLRDSGIAAIFLIIVIVWAVFDFLSKKNSKSESEEVNESKQKEEVAEPIFSVSKKEVLEKKYDGISEKYRLKFVLIDDRDGRFKPQWNWWAFLLSPFWYLNQGMWAKAIIIGVCIIFGGVISPLFYLYSGICGNYDYYLLKVKNKQLW